MVVHIFMEAEREYYNLEKLWADAERIPFSDRVNNADSAYTHLAQYYDRLMDVDYEEWAEYLRQNMGKVGVQTETDLGTSLRHRWSNYTSCPDGL